MSTRIGLSPGRGDEHPWRYFVPGDPEPEPIAFRRHGLAPSLPVDEQLRIVRTGAVDLITEDDFRRKLGTGRSLRIKLGIDPTASDIHLGFAVVLRKLRQFQELGHTAVLIIGDFTAQVGDPSGKSATRPRLAKEEVEGFATTYVEQARRILLDEPLEIRRNSEWLGTMGIEDVLRLAARTTVARMLERDDFSRRYRDGVAISVMEFLYPLLQGWDSVMVEADVELGGTDQLFNNLMGRTLQEQEGQEGQCVLTTPLLEGLDGVNKMSKSLGNFVGIAEAPGEQFGKLLVAARRAHAPLLHPHDRLAPGSHRRGHHGPGRRVAQARSTPSACWPAPSSTSTTATVPARPPRPSSTGCSGPTRSPTRSPTSRSRPSRRAPRRPDPAWLGCSPWRSRGRCRPTRRACARSSRAA